MDEFGVLVESIGFKAHGKSAPMAKSKPKPKSHFSANNTAAFNDSSSLPVDELDGIFRSNLNIGKTQQPQSFVGDDDIFGGGVSNSNQFGGIDLESVLNTSSNTIYDSNPSLRNSGGVNGYVDLLGSQPSQSDSVEDLLGGFGVKSSGNQENKAPGFDDSIPGFGEANPTNKEVQSKTVLSPGSNGRTSNSSSTLVDEPFLVFESSVSQPEQDTKKDRIRSSLDELDDFVKGRALNDSKSDEKNTATSKLSPGTASKGFENIDDLDAILGGGAQQKRAAPTPTTQDSQVEEKRPKAKQTSPAANFRDNFKALFGEIATSSEEFQEKEGESEERRRARLNIHMRTNARVAEALAEKNQRDLKNQHEQDEKHRLGETLGNDIRCWAAGKEGNLRALLSSLQQVLWPDSGWRPVSLTDLITPDSVKKVYKKATLYVHPDKVQQKGLQQKYIAEKVFDLLKEAWNKFSVDELGRV